LTRPFSCPCRSSLSGGQNNTFLASYSFLILSPRDTYSSQTLSTNKKKSYSSAVDIMSYSSGEGSTELSSNVAPLAHGMLWGPRSSPATRNFDNGSTSPSSPSFSGPGTIVDELHNWSPPPVCSLCESSRTQLTQSLHLQGRRPLTTLCITLEPSVRA
jgi:hypothetical protein